VESFSAVSLYYLCFIATLSFAFVERRNQCRCNINVTSHLRQQSFERSSWRCGSREWLQRRWG